MTTAVIGLGSIGGTVARNLVEGGQAIIVSERNLDKAQAAAQRLGPAARALPMNEAVREADILVLAIWFDAIKAFVADHHDSLAGKIVVDPSNPIAPDGKGGFVKTIHQDQSSGRLIAGLLPPGVRLVKAFGSLGAGTLASAARRTPDRAVLFYAADDAAAGRQVAGLIEASGFAPVPVGGLDQSIRIEVFGDLHEFGKLGRAVSVQEAEQAIGRSP